MNTRALDFFRSNYVPGRICLIGANDIVGKLIRDGQAGLTPDGKPSKWSHSFIMGEKRRDGEIYIFESDLHVNVDKWMVQNGAMESRISKWCGDTIENACVLGMELTPDEQDAVVANAMALAYGEPHFSYPVGELFGTLWAILTRSLSRKNIFDDKYAAQCATFVRMNYQKINHDPLGSPIDLSNTSPEKIFQSSTFTTKIVL